VEFLVLLELDVTLVKQSRLGSQPTANELDEGCAKVLHDHLCEQYNAEDEELDKLRYNHRILDNEHQSTFDFDQFTMIE
jgi:hypothetical protein